MFNTYLVQNNFIFEYGGITHIFNPAPRKQHDAGEDTLLECTLPILGDIDHVDTASGQGRSSRSPEDAEQSLRVMGPCIAPCCNAKRRCMWVSKTGEHEASIQRRGSGFREPTDVHALHISVGTWLISGIFHRTWHLPYLYASDRPRKGFLSNFSYCELKI
jgi:hypothetical protein